MFELDVGKTKNSTDDFINFTTYARVIDNAAIPYTLYKRHDTTLYSG